jgi:hypothetical protein
LPSKSRREPLQVGNVYELDYGGKVYVVLVVGECVAKTVRFKREEPGWRLLVLDAHGWVDESIRPGSVVEWVKAAEIFKYAKRQGNGSDLRASVRE